MTAPAEPSGTHLYLVRHGATEANERVPYILQGSGIDLPLSPRGRDQAAALARFFSQRPIRRVYSSGMARARETARAIAGALGHEPGILADIQECHVGRWEGLDWETIRREFPAEHQRFLDNPAEQPYLGGESYGDVFRRAHPVIDRLLDQHAGEEIVVVAHNVVNRVLTAHLLGLEIRQAQALHQGNGCINLIRRRAGRTELVTYNTLFHLNEREG
ncbi:MAG TPA: histidine phosphatase family protein [Planctomycetaceae bacterium]|nr:histidine phosphatase family protein [Planctomycetaceae bacterium]